MGGKWIIRLRKGLASRCWENLILAMLGEQFMVGEEICGAVVSVRFQVRTQRAVPPISRHCSLTWLHIPKEDIISIWNKTASDQATTARIRDTLRRVLNLPPNTIMEYKTHTDSIKYVCLFVHILSWVVSFEVKCLVKLMYYTRCRAWEDFHGLVNASGGR